jgi:hypothetical protein
MTACQGSRARVPMSAFIGCPRSDARDIGLRPTLRNPRAPVLRKRVIYTS